MIVMIVIIAVCEVIRAIQNLIQLRMLKHDEANRDNAYDEFVKSLKADDKEFVQKALEAFEKDNRERGTWVKGMSDIGIDVEGYRCDQCGKFIPWDYEHSSPFFIEKYHFCPFCGTKMKARVSDERVN